MTMSIMEGILTADAAECMHSKALSVVYPAILMRSAVARRATYP